MPLFLSSHARRTILMSVFIVTSIAISTSAAAQQSDEFSWWQSIKDHVNNVADNGDDELYVSGVAHHGRSTYTAEKLAQLNEHAWGLGYGKTLRNDSGNDESLFAFVLKDSHRHPEYQAGYAYEWIYQIPHTSLELGGGYTAMMMSRQDYFDSVPFPIALPVASIGTKKAKLMFSYVPRLSSSKNSGDVLLIFGRIAF